MNEQNILQAIEELNLRVNAIDEGMIHHIGGRATVLVNPTVTGAIRWSDVSILRDGAGILGIYDLAGLNYASLACDDIAMIGSLSFEVDAEAINAPNADDDYTLIQARDNGVGLIEVARLVGGADPYISLGLYNGIRAGLASLLLDTPINTYDNILSVTNANYLSAGNVDNWYFTFNARDNGSAVVEVARLVGAADPEFQIGNNGNVIRGTRAGLLGFFGLANPVGQRLKANYNNWAAFGDVVDALVALGLFDAA